ncbi:DUF748 domain-containing protein [Azovibrio restrictus]|uniref:DUF748 domain-containing protein n=1 Tax=Azovibrio restrictus TaxID=146938 RepID=UPI0026F1DE5C|nr:DUF748 domain-containing protein [Azovibrio restrictus]
MHPSPTPPAAETPASYASAVPARGRRWPWIAGGLLLALLLGGFVAFQVAVHLLKEQIVAALGPRGEVRELKVGLTGVEILGLRLPADPASGKGAWPAPDLLRAERILVVPSVTDLLGARVVLDSIRIEGAYLSILRTRAGRVQVLPSLTEAGAARAPGGEPGQEQDAAKAVEVRIGQVELVDSAVEFFDASVRQPALKVRLEQLNARVGPLAFPDLTGQSQVQVEGVIKGQHQDGQLNLAGQAELASKESDLKTRLRGVDLTALQPYLIKAAETGVRRGTLDLDLHTTVKKNQLHGPGTLTLNQLELSSSGNAFMGMPRSAVVAMMKDRQGKISVNFVLSGNINDPGFSLNENLMGKVGSAVADSLGISFEGLAKGVGSAGSSVARGLGDSLGKLFK